MDNKNLFLVLILSFGFLFGWQYFVVGPQQEVEQAAFEQQQKLEEAAQAAAPTSANTGSASNLPQSNGSNLPTATNDGAVKVTSVAQASNLSLAEQKAQNLRVIIDSSRMSGSITLTGGRVDDIILKDYSVELNGEERVRIFSPSGTEAPYYADFGWAPVNGVVVPNADTVWTASGKTLSEASPVTLNWDNGAGLVFSRIYSVDENFLINVEQK